jgi:nicotinamidase-related amidase
LREKPAAAAASPASEFMNGQFAFDPGDVLVVIDVINDFQHEDGDRLLASFEERLTAMAETLASARAGDIPIVYVNDERDRWQSDVSALIRAALDSKRGDGIVKRLRPRPGDHILLKHRYSAFDHTALDLLLEQLHVERLVLMGAATEGCIVQSAIDAREHNLKVTIVADACATTDPELETIALNYADRVVGAHIADRR